MIQFTRVAAAAFLLVAYAGPAFASIGLEADGAHADGHTGGEIGATYSYGIAGFSLTPGVGGFIYHSNGDTKVKPYGRVEATYHIPAFATIGAGVRISGENTRPYGTVALPLVSMAPSLALKANAGPHYYAAGLSLGF